MRANVWQEAIAHYVTSMQAAGRSPGTIRVHRHYLTHLRKHVKRPFTASSEAIERALAVPSWSQETRKSARSVFVGFYKWAARSGRIEVNPTRDLPAVSVPPGVARPAPEAVLERALRVADGRERIMILLAAKAGMRCAEIARAHKDDLVGQILYVYGKGGKTRRVPIISPALLAAFARADGYLFPGPNGHLTPGHVSKLINAVLPEGWTAHTLRHRFATCAYAGTLDLLAVQDLLGHSRPETTRRYVVTPPDSLFAAVLAADRAGDKAA